MKDDLHVVLGNLTSSKATQRKDAVARMKQLLEQPLCREEVDQCTFQGRKHPTDVDWASLVEGIMAYVDVECQKTRGKAGVRPDVGVCIRWVIKKALDAERRDSRPRLGIVYRRLTLYVFEHIQDTRMKSLRSEFVGALLLLLDVQHYAMHLERRDTQEILAMLLEGISEATVSSGATQMAVELPAQTRAVAALIEHHQKDFSSDCIHSTLDTFIMILPRMKESQNFSTIIGALNQLLARYGANSLDDAERFFVQIHATIHEAWRRQPRNRKVKDQLVALMRLRLRLAQLDGRSRGPLRGLDEIALLLRDEFKDSASPSSGLRLSISSVGRTRWQMTAFTVALMDLAADVFVEVDHWDSAMEPNDEGNHGGDRPSKRVRKASWASVLVDSLLQPLHAASLGWLQCTYFLLHKHPNFMSQKHILELLTCFASQKLDNLQEFLPEIQIWTLLATSALLSSSPRRSRATRPGDEIVPLVHSIWETIITKAPHLPPHVCDMCLAVLGTIIRSRFMNTTNLVASFDHWWPRIPVHDDTGLSRSTMDFILSILESEVQEGLGISGERDRLCADVLDLIRKHLTNDSSFFTPHMAVMLSRALSGMIREPSDERNGVEGIEWPVILAKTEDDGNSRTGQEAWKVFDEQLAALERVAALPQSSSLVSNEAHTAGIYAKGIVVILEMLDTVVKDVLASEEVSPSSSIQSLFIVLVVQRLLATEEALEISSHGNEFTAALGSIVTTMFERFSTMLPRVYWDHPSLLLLLALLKDLFESLEHTVRLDESLKGIVVFIQSIVGGGVGLVTYDGATDLADDDEFNCTPPDSSDSPRGVECKPRGEITESQKRDCIDTLSKLAHVSRSMRACIVNAFESIRQGVTSEPLRRDVLYNLCKVRDIYAVQKVVPLFKELHATMEKNDDCARRILLRCAGQLSVTLRSLKEGVDHDALDLTDEVDLLRTLTSDWIEVWRRGRMYARGTRQAFVECLKDVLLLDTDTFVDLSRALVHMLGDPDYSVRYDTIQYIGVVFDAFSNPSEQEDILDSCKTIVWGQSHCHGGNLPQLSAEYTRTSLLFLAEVCLHSAHLEQTAIFDLCLHARVLSWGEFVDRLLKSLCQCLHYESIIQMMEENFVVLLEKWIRSDSPILEFPVHLLGFSCCEEFMKRHFQYITAVALLCGRAELVERVADVTGMEITQVYRQSFAAIFAFSLPLYSTHKGREAGQRVIEGILRSSLGSDEVDQLIRKSIDDIFNLLLELVALPQPPGFSCAIIQKTLSSLAGMHRGTTSLSDLLRTGSDRIHRLFLGILERLSRVHRPHTRQLVWKSFVFFVEEILDVRLVTPSDLRHISHITFLAMQEPTLVADCCMFLRVLARDILAQKTPRSKSCRQQLGTIVSSLVPIARHQTEALSVLEFLVCDCQQEMDSVIETLDPFPPEPIFARVNEIYQSIRGERSLEEEIVQFVCVDTATTSSFVARVARLAHLEQLLRERRQELSHLLTSVDDRTPGVIPVLIRKLTKMASNTARSESSDELNMIAACLGLIGVISFDFHTSLPVLTTHNVHWSMKKEVLVLCNRYLTDTTFEVVLTASKTLGQLLRMQAGREAYVGKECEKSDKELAELLSPFAVDQCRKTPRAKQLHSVHPRLPIDSDELWVMNGRTHTEWICQLAFCLAYDAAEDEVLKLCACMARLKAEMAELIFPHLLYDIIRNDIGGSMCILLSNKISDFLRPHPEECGESLRFLLSALNFLRKERCRQLRDKSSRNRMGRGHFDTEFFLDVDYRLVAEAGLRCQAYLTSLLHMELWIEKEKERNDGSIGLPAANFFGGDGVPLSQQILLAVYSNIRDPDGIYGVNRNYGVHEQILTYEHECDWTKALGAYDNLLQEASDGDGVPILQRGVLAAMQNMGLFHVLELYLAGTSRDTARWNATEELSEAQYQAAWRKGTWHLSGMLGGSGFHAIIHRCLRALDEGNHDLFESTLRAARENLAHEIGLVTTESMMNALPVLAKIQMLSEIWSAWSIKQDPHHHDNVPSLIHSWEHRLVQMYGVVDLSEPILALRGVLLRLLRATPLVPHHLAMVSKVARKSGRIHLAASAIHQMKQASGPGQRDLGLLLEESRVLWAHGEHEMAVGLAKHVATTCSEGETRCRALCFAGRWLGQTRLEGFRTIIETYLKRAVAQSGVSSCIEAKSHYELASCADSLHSTLVEKLKSNEWCMAQRMLQQKRDELDHLQRLIDDATRRFTKDPSFDDWKRHRNTLQRQIKEYEKEHQKVQKDQGEFLSLALEEYHRCLCTTDKYDIRVAFRMIALWFGNVAGPDAKEINAQMQDRFDIIESRKFLPLVYQIASRLGKEDSTGFQAALTRGLFRMGREHPYHTLHQLFSLCNGRNLPHDQKKAGFYVVEQDKIDAANRIVNLLKGAGYDNLIKATRYLIDAYIDLAYTTKKFERDTPYPLPRSLQRSAEFQFAAVPTADIPIDPTCAYKDVVRVHKFEDTFTVTSGISKPKIAHCIGTDGHTYKQLVKGKDDLRQDAVMEQLFGMVNVLLRRDPETRRRRLSVRTYKVVPLTPAAGLVDWVLNTMPLGQYLISSPTNTSQSAHVRYRPDDLTPLQCRKIMQAAAQPGKTRSQKRDEFDTICKKFKPVLHHFFLEYFPEPVDWYEKRRSYTRSVAANSIVGYAVGLGDRHMFNILVDKSTAEVVQIDLGLAFEQGKLLPTPESVPFRLTRDIVDGFGVTSVEGTFRRCCEETMRVLRENAQVLLTIVEVFIYDPLYNWALSPTKALRFQHDELDGDAEEGTSETGDSTAHPLGGSSSFSSSSSPTTPTTTSSSGVTNADAEYVLFRLSQKLQGWENGECLGVKGQVNKLINDARDPEYLSQMFYGWGAWL